MVAKITTPASIRRALNYNEKKVLKGQAACIGASGFLKGINDLYFYDKLNRFQHLIELNTRAKTNTLHVSLNFDPREHFSIEKLNAIASDYMSRIGFGDQPFLVYQHFDAAHPHVHIVTTTIQESGKRIDTFNIGRNQSEKARKQIEEEYGLVKATRKAEQVSELIYPVRVHKVKYGVSETKRSIANVLSVVVNQYRFTSLPELNAVLKLYNIVADRGQEESRTYRNGGLHYRLLDEQGNRAGVPIKASSIHFKPTLKYLENKFAQNELLRQPLKRKLRTAIEWTMTKRPESFKEFINQLKKESVTVVLRDNGQGIIYGLTFIDHQNKTVFNGSALGKMYSAAGIRERIEGGLQEQRTGGRALLESSHKKRVDTEHAGIVPEKVKDKGNEEHCGRADTTSKENLWELLMNKEKEDPRIPLHLMRKKRKRRFPKL